LDFSQDFLAFFCSENAKNIFKNIGIFCYLALATDYLLKMGNSRAWEIPTILCGYNGYKRGYRPG